jgi:hypothetical protein
MAGTELVSRDVHAAVSGSEAAFIPQRDGGASFPRAWSAPVSATYVFEGKKLSLRQFQTAFGLLAVSSATAKFPPKASITSDAVESNSMRSTYSKEFGSAIPK